MLIFIFTSSLPAIWHQIQWIPHLTSMDTTFNINGYHMTSMDTTSDINGYHIWHDQWIRLTWSMDTMSDINGYHIWHQWIPHLTLMDTTFWHQWIHLTSMDTPDINGYVWHQWIPHLTSMDTTWHQWTPHLTSMDTTSDINGYHILTKHNSFKRPVLYFTLLDMTWHDMKQSYPYWTSTVHMFLGHLVPSREAGCHTNTTVNSTLLITSTTSWGNWHSLWKINVRQIYIAYM